MSSGSAMIIPKIRVHLYFYGGEIIP